MIGVPTVLPNPDFQASARALDQKRLGTQRVETVQVLRGLTRPGYGWRHHPAVKMWAGYEEGLVRYGLDVCAVWLETGRGPRGHHRRDAGGRPRRRLWDHGHPYAGRPGRRR
jgi:hypothetical protein